MISSLGFRRKYTQRQRKIAVIIIVNFLLNHFNYFGGGTACLRPYFSTTYLRRDMRESPGKGFVKN